MRLHQWVKNLLVFAPAFFAGTFFVQETLFNSIRLFFAFSFLASAIYIFNDICDRKSDAKHPKKKFRPIASEETSVGQGYALIIALLIVVFNFAITFDIKIIFLLGLYLVVNLIYSCWLKHVPLIDVFIVASMYFIRLKAGGELLHIELSEWLILMTFLLALFLIIGKRRAELASGFMGTRRVLQEYNEKFLDACLLTVVSSTLITYSLYTVSVGIPYLSYSVFIAFFGMFRYLYIIYVLGGGEAPEKILMKDPWILSSAVLCVCYLFILFYL